MSIPAKALFVRVRHLKNSKGSIYLNDIDTYPNRFEGMKVQVYVPFGQTIDIPLVDEVLLSYKRGSIFKSMQDNRIDAYILHNNEVVDLISDSYQIHPNENLLLMDSSAGDVNITLPDISLVGNGNEFVIKKVTEDSNTIHIKGLGSDTLDGESHALEMSESLSALTIKSSSSGWWVSARYPPGTITNGTGGEDGLSAYEIAVDEGFVGTIEEWLDSLQGPEGPPGADGEQGEDGLSFTWRGTWDEDISYSLNDVVSYQGSSYIAVVDSVGTVPGDNADWGLLASKGDDGTGGTGEDKTYPSLAARDSSDSSWVYVGKTEDTGQSEDDEVWQIYRQNIEDTNLPQEFAGGINDFTHRWTERENLNYEEL